MDVDNPAAIVAAVAERHRELAGLLRGLDRTALVGPSRLDGWDRLTIVCHLRHGAAASSSMTVDTLAGKPTAFYPGGRDSQRPTTLTVAEGESPRAAVESLIAESAELDTLWAGLHGEQWKLRTTEPDDNPDLGSISLGALALLRLTEVEVHGRDLDIGAGPWSSTFVDEALEMRLRWLPVRRSNHRRVDTSVVGTWVFEAVDGLVFAVELVGSEVNVASGPDMADGDAVISGTGRELLAFLLGRLELDQLQVRGSLQFAESFHQAFPGP